MSYYSKGTDDDWLPCGDCGGKVVLKSSHKTFGLDVPTCTECGDIFTTQDEDDEITSRRKLMEND